MKCLASRRILDDAGEFFHVMSPMPFVMISLLELSSLAPSAMSPSPAKSDKLLEGFSQDLYHRGHLLAQCEVGQYAQMVASNQSKKASKLIGSQLCLSSKPTV